ncbi:MAG TPA: tripartite tricarboxylate transporter substrate-binding protein [Burkholderiaceae bacterium]|nr:tripartite tricarboxylate transporter substrate-binding protein [Burkholderiaceae bacterium]
MPAPSRRAVLRTATLAALGGPARHALAQPAPWPDRTIRLLLGFPPGGGSDMVTRLVAQKIGPLLGQQVVVENRVGAGGLIASEAASRSTPDGHTWILLPSGHATQAAMLKKMPMDPVAGFQWIGTVTVYPMFLCVANESPVRTLRDLLERARAAPGKLTYTSAGVGTAHHLIGEWLNADAGIDLVHVPYKGTVAAFTDLAAGRVDLMIDTAPSTLPLLKGGRLRGIAVTSAAGRSPVPGVAPALETVPGLEYESWLGIAMPPGTPAPIVERANGALREVLAQQDVVQRLEEFGGTPAPGTPDAFRERVQRDIERFRRIVAVRKLPQE